MKFSFGLLTTPKEKFNRYRIMDYSIRKPARALSNVFFFWEGREIDRAEREREPFNFPRNPAVARFVPMFISAGGNRQFFRGWIIRLAIHIYIYIYSDEKLWLPCILKTNFFLFFFTFLKIKIFDFPSFIFCIRSAFANTFQTFFQHILSDLK